MKIDGAQMLTIASGEVEPASASLEDQNTGVDSTGRAYALELGEDFEISSVNSPVNSPGSVEVVSEITRYRLQAQLSHPVRLPKPNTKKPTTDGCRPFSMVYCRL